MLVNFEVVGDEPPSVAAYRADGTKPPAADLTGIYARFPTGRAWPITVTRFQRKLP